ncbi:MAG: hypothetical protein HYV92_09630 [Candidatus Rokubacteria bacterium]|nr:hypothetical protein [Candidatus Rokubacteria bacterium]MBI2554656.1 hypothetical protein [Candidatus Rokubacteria bacterium]
MPAAEGIGPWIGSWIVLHVALRNRELNLVGIGIATRLLWPPVFEYLAGH